ncbi:MULTISPECIES: cell division ATP-binding protein FtsE [Dermacoccus]|uniref:cell division ATP-binding protein FtsE n=1 Tax=Dermacoccus TaxID=57495 RepID=UPI00093AC76A|nr:MULTISPECIES: cell division ATP-binding protein FtsE [Dermacoccus]MBO1758409.1 cell division ATP-binding protein FtsE [Dermacoccus sp. NHGro5]
MIRFDHVSLTYGRKLAPALDDVSFDIERGEFVFLVGQSGSGKSSLMRLMTHEVTATSGQIHIAGRDLMTMPRRKVPSLRRDIGVVFQDFRLLENKTVAENVAFVLEILGWRRGAVRTAVPEALELVGLAEKSRRFPHELSGGEQQRVAIARAVVKQPAILLADEPTGNLDPENSEEVVGVLDRVNRTSTTLVMATHDNSLVDRLQRRVIEMSDGRLVRDSTGGYRSEATSRRSGARRLDAVAEQDGHDSHDAHDDPSALDGTTTAIPGARATRRGRDITGAAS